MNATAYVNHIATNTPRHDVHRDFVDFAVRGFVDSRDARVFERMVERSHISHRWAAMSDIDDFYSGCPNDVSLHQRMCEYRLRAPELAIDTVERLRPHLGAITHLIVVSSTGFYTPGIDFDLIDAFGISPSVERTNLLFMGCHAGINGLKVARHVIRSEPAARVLLVTIELCSLHLQHSQSLEAMLSYLIFSDGCAAAVISSDPSGISLDSFTAVRIADTADLMTLRIGHRSVEMFLSGQVPLALKKALGEPEITRSILGDHGKDSIDIWAIHPGGRSILDAVADAIELRPDDLQLSRSVLDDYGNMASATILFVLAAAMDTFPPGSIGCAMGFGPGLTAETFIFRTHGKGRTA